MDGGIILMVINFLQRYNFVQFNNGSDTMALINWGFVSSWMVAILSASFIYGIRGVNKRIFYKQLILATVFYFSIQTVLFVLGKIDLISPSSIVVILLATTASIFLFRSFLFLCYKLMNFFGNKKRVIIIGCNQKAELLARGFANNTSKNLEFFGFFNNYDPESEYFKRNFKGYLDSVKPFCMEHHINEIYYTLRTDNEYIKDLSNFADTNFIFLGFVPDLEMQQKKMIDTTYVDHVDLPIISFRYSPLQQKGNSFLKRVFDVFFSSIAIVILSLFILPVIALAIRLDSRGPIFFVQKRPGRNNRLFDCYKFRTMVVNNQTEKSATKSDSRITRVGAILRKTSLDELPQFFNVLKGDMSIVGPRPNLIYHLNHYAQSIPEYYKRHIITPGITGFAQISGCRGEIQEDYHMKKRLKYDLLYMQNWSLLMDFKIIGMTILKLFKGDEKAY
jgi:putative colanic acid biosynthesis UDP-glucose lipid carrier transferase